jgi:hypothetical protein
MSLYLSSAKAKHDIWMVYATTSYTRRIRRLSRQQVTVPSEPRAQVLGTKLECTKWHSFCVKMCSKQDGQSRLGDLCLRITRAVFFSIASESRASPVVQTYWD